MFDLIKSSKEALKSALVWQRKYFGDEFQAAKFEKDIKRSILNVFVAESALANKPAIAIYGASQAGKSYLTATLAKDDNGRVITNIGKDRFDFIKDINPQGGKESTALVTRFTTSIVKHPSEYPIALKVFRPFDLIKLFVNSFALDIEDYNNDDSFISELDKNISQLITMKTSSSFSETSSSKKYTFDISEWYDLELYCSEKFSFHSHFQALKKIQFWDRVERALSNSDVDIFKIAPFLWNNVKRYTDYFEVLIIDLARLGFPTTLFCSLSALFEQHSDGWKRRDAGIINVEALTDSNSFIINCINSEGEIATINASHLCALAYELVISLSGNVDEYFERADILDFPGARSRKAQSLKSFEAEGAVEPIDNFLRGKIAYLFDKYVRELSITGMILCVGPSNQDVVGLDRLIEDWIIKTHGLNADERSKVNTSLFLVLTKLDLDLTNDVGKEVGPLRFDTRLKASLEEPFGTRHSFRTNWVSDWTKNKPFNNTFWLRNPNADQSQFIHYESEPGRSKELSIRADKVKLIDELRIAFLQSNAAKRHFTNAPRSWDAALTLNDGGASYLMDQVRALVKSDFHIRQIRQLIFRELSERLSDLRSYALADDISELKAQQEKIAQDFVLKCNILLQKERLGEFIKVLCVEDSLLKDVFEQTIKHYELRQMMHSDEEVLEVELDDELAVLIGKPEKTLASPDLLPASKRFAHHFIGALFSSWAQSVTSRLSDGSLARYLQCDREFAVRLVSELETHAKITGFDKDLEAKLDRVMQVNAGDQRVKSWMFSAIAAADFNNFVERGGFRGNEPIEIDLPQGVRKRLFDKSEWHIGQSVIELKERDFSRRLLLDWILATQHSIRENANPGRFSQEQLEQNRTLISIINVLNNDLLALENLQ